MMRIRFIILIMTLSTCHISLGWTRYVLDNVWAYDLYRHAGENRADLVEAFAALKQNAEHLTIPEYIEYEGEQWKVVSIGSSGDDETYNWPVPESVFAGFDRLKSVEIPSTVRNIGASSFRNCVNLSKVILPESLENLGDSAFQYCTSLSDITSLNNLASLGASAFQGCSALTRIHLPSGLTTINAKAFQDCISLAESSIPESVVEIKEYAFYNCTNLQTIVFHDALKKIGISAFARCSSLTNINIPESIAEVGEHAFYDTPWYDNLDDGPVYLGKIAYSYHGEMPVGTKIYVNEGIENIDGDFLSEWPNLEYVYLPKSVKTFHSKAFLNCTHLKALDFAEEMEITTLPLIKGCNSLVSISIPNAICRFGGFDECDNLKEIHVSDLKVWNDMKFSSYRDNPLRTIRHLFINDLEVKGDFIIPTSITKVNDYVFCYLPEITSVTFPDHVESIAPHAFSNCCNIEQINFNCKTVMPLYYIREEEFFSDSEAANIRHSVKKITLGEQTNTIGANAFKDFNKLSEIVLSNSITTICDYAFYGCEKLESINIPTSVKKIGQYVFQQSGLTEMPDYLPEVTNNMFAGCRNLKSAYLPEGTQTIPSGLFKGCSALETITINEDVTSIGNYVFEDCISLSSIIIPQNVTSIGSYAFSGCTSLESIKIPPKMDFIYTGAFHNCKNISSFCVPIGINTINSDSFSGCENLENVTLPSSLIIIGDNAFSSTGIKSITLPNGLERIGMSAFENCYSLKRISIPNSVTTINNYAFRNCVALEEINIPTNRIERGLCAGDESLESVVLSQNLNYIMYDAFRDCYTLDTISIPQKIEAIYVNTFIRAGEKHSKFSIRLESTNPPNVLVYENYYSNSGYGFFPDYTILYVPKGSRNKYLAAPYWKDAKEIIEYDNTGIIGIGMTSESWETKDVIFNVNGIKIPKPQKGINIIRKQKILY